MNHRNEEYEEELEINMTPMLDIVFIMLIFFIVTAVFVKEPGVSVLRPQAETGNEVKRVSILIGVTADDKIWINKKEIKLEEVRTVVDKMHKENPRGNVVIQADTDSQSGVVVAIIQTLSDLGVEGVSVATRKGGKS